MGVLDQGWMWPVNYAKALSMDERYGAEATHTIHELVGAGKSRSYVASASVGSVEARRVLEPCRRPWRAGSFLHHYAERKGFKGHEG
jgi:hypothetical protein